jgi:hypothetical protein
MSYPHIRPITIGGAQSASTDAALAPNPSPSFALMMDGAVDAALRSVPLPDGLLARLERMALAMPDESADQVDYLGC